MIALGHLDVNVVTHCNQRCVSCSHASPFVAPWSMTGEMLARDLAALRGIVHFKVIQMVGGEPTLHRDLCGLMRIARESGVGDSVCVISNGRLLPRMTDEFWQTMDWLQLSIYPTLDPAVVELAEAKCRQFGKPFYSTRFTDFHQQFRRVESDGSNFKDCHWKTNCFTVHDGYFALCPQAVFFPKEFMGLGQFVDCLPLAGLTEAALDAYLHRVEPFNACRICAANEMKTRPWAEAKTKDEWREESFLR